MPKYVFVVAYSLAEAKSLLESRPDLGWNYREEAEWHLEEIRRPPTDPFYGDQYKIWTVEVA